MRYLIYGSQGWIGQQFVKTLEKMHPEVVIIPAQSRADDTPNVIRELEETRPIRVISLIGRTHGPGYSTIDYLEQPGKLVENVRDNLFSPVQLALLCSQRNIHFTYLGTGCIFDSMGEDREFTEEDIPNFFGSGYSVVKGFTDRLMHLLEGNTLQLRIRMPIVGYHHPRNFITKITQYSRVISVPNSMTILPILMPYMIDLIYRGAKGTYNMTNPGTITHNQILEKYKKKVDPTFEWTNFTIEEQNQILASKRSNNALNTDKLVDLYPLIPTIEEGIDMIMDNWK